MTPSSPAEALALYEAQRQRSSEAEVLSLPDHNRLLKERRLTQRPDAPTLKQSFRSATRAKLRRSLTPQLAPQSPPLSDSKLFSTPVSDAWSEPEKPGGDSLKRVPSVWRDAQNFWRAWRRAAMSRSCDEQCGTPVNKTTGELLVGHATSPERNKIETNREDVNLLFSTATDLRLLPPVVLRTPSQAARVHHPPLRTVADHAETCSGSASQPTFRPHGPLDVFFRIAEVGSDIIAASWERLPDIVAQLHSVWTAQRLKSCLALLQVFLIGFLAISALAGLVGAIRGLLLSCWSILLPFRWIARLLLWFVA